MYSAKSSGNRTLSECPWNARKYRKCLEELGFKQYWNLFFGPPPLVRKVIQAWTVHCEVPSNFTLIFSIRSSNLTAPSSSRGMVSSCRSNLIMNFDTSKQPRLHVAGLVSIHLLSRIGVGTGDNVTASFGRGLAFATAFPVRTCSAQRFQQEFLLTFLSRVCWFHSRREPKKLFGLEIRDSIIISTQKRPWRKKIFTSKDWADLRFSTNPPLKLGMVQHFEVMYTLDIMYSYHRVSLHQV